MGIGLACTFLDNINNAANLWEFLPETVETNSSNLTRGLPVLLTRGHVGEWLWQGVGG